MAKIFVESKRNNRNEFQFLRYEFSYKFTTKIRYEFFQSIFRKDERFDLEKRERERESKGSIRRITKRCCLLGKIFHQPLRAPTSSREIKRTNEVA